MSWIVPVQRIRIGKDCGCLFKQDAMLFKVGNRLRDIPRKDIHVYTLIRLWSQGRWRSEGRTLDTIATPCSVNAEGACLLPPHFELDIAIWDFKFSNSCFVSWSMKSLGN